MVAGCSQPLEAMAPPTPAPAPPPIIGATEQPAPAPATQSSGPPTSPTAAEPLRPAAGIAAPLEAREVVRGSAEVPRVALTFDCGSVAGASGALLEVLRLHELRVTFFVTGQYVERYPELVRQIVADGHEIANHTHSHADLTELTDEAIQEELQRTEAAVQKLTGRSTRPWMRTPFGARNPRVLEIVAQAGYVSVYWTLDSGDWWAEATEQGVRDRVLKNTAKGYIVVQHCAASATADALGAIIQGLQARGLAIVTVSALLDPGPQRTTLAGDGLLAPVSKRQVLPATYVPRDLMGLVSVPVTQPALRLRGSALTPLRAMLEEAQRQGLAPHVLSAYRSYQEQAAIYQRMVQRLGETAASRVSARPGHSEHQLGTTVDFTSPAVGYALVQSFGTTAEGLWLRENAHLYGFVMSYPAGKEAVTGYVYEPWHYRYVGVGAATAVYQQGMTLHEYVAAGR